MDFDDPDKEDAERLRVDRGDYPLVADVLCSTPPSGVDLHTFLGEPVNLHKRGLHASYSREYFRFAPVASASKERSASARMVLPLEAPVRDASAAWVNAMALAQDKFFKQVDAFQLEPSVPEACSMSDPDSSAERNSKDATCSILTTFAGRRPSHTLILEAAIHLLQQGLCNVRGKDVINVKWAMALLHFSVWVQLKKVTNGFVGRYWKRHP